MSDVNFLPGFFPVKAIPNPDFIMMVDHLLFTGDWILVPLTKVQPVGVLESYVVAVRVFNDRLVSNNINDNNECLNSFQFNIL